MKIILDTNVITKDYSLQGGRILKLSDAAKKLGYEVFIPEVVVDEIIHQYREELQEAHHRYLKGVRSLGRMGFEVKTATEDDFIEKSIEDKEKKYLKRLNELGIKVLPYPSTKHNDIVKKELFGKKPFANSQKGYRDSLIWETVLEQLVPVKDLLYDTQVLFLSSNTHDFAAKDNSLHPDLIEDFTDKGFMECAVELVADIDMFFNETINGELEELETIANTLKNKHKFNRVNLDVEFRSLLYDEYVMGDVLLQEDEDGGSLFPQMYENPSVQDVNLKSINAVYVHRLQDGTAIVDCEIEAVADFDFCLFKGDYALLDDDSPITILDRDWNEHYSLATTQACIAAHATFRVSDGLYRVISKEIYTKNVTVVV